MSGLYGYLNDHLAGAAAAIQLAERCRAREPQSELGRVLQVVGSPAGQRTFVADVQAGQGQRCRFVERNDASLSRPKLVAKATTS
jgi:hypothetical protein